MNHRSLPSFSLSLSLAQRLALVFALLALFAAGLTAYFAYRDSREALVVTAKEQLSTATRVLGRRIALTLDSVERDLLLLAQHPDSARALAGDAESVEHAADLFARMIANRHAYFQIRLIAANGMETVRVDRSPNGPLPVGSDDLQEKLHYPYVFETLALPRGGIYVSPAAINHERGAHDAEGQPSIQLAMAIARAGKPLGVAIINLDLDGLFRLLATDLPGEAEVFLTNDSGDFLIHPQPGVAFAFDRGRRVLAQELFPETRPLFAGETESISLQMTAGAREEPARIASFLRVDALPSVWRAAGGERGMRVVLGLAQPLSGVLAKSAEMAGNAIRNVLIAGLIAALLAFVLARAVTASLRQIERAIANFGRAGAVELPTMRRDEIGNLARRFAAMQQQIRAQMVTLEAQSKALDHEAQHDWLTGLANRRNLIGFLPQALARAARQETRLALFFIDLDGFKPINDTYGHGVGDRVLVEIAGRLAHGVRAGDYIARPGGDEFVIVCEGLEAATEEGLIADKLIRLIGAPIPIDGRQLSVGASIGIARYPVDGRDAETLTGAADRAMYAAKSAGRGVWRLAGDGGPAAAAATDERHDTETT